MSFTIRHIDVGNTQTQGGSMSNKKRLSVEDIINREKGKTAFVAAMGPSLSNNRDMIWQAGGSEDHILLCCNDIDYAWPDLEWDYWVLANSELRTTTSLIDRVNSRKHAMFCYCDSIDPTPNDEPNKGIEEQFLAYECRHFDNKACGPRNPCCDKMVDGRRAVQEFLKEYCECENMYSPGSTVALHMVALAILMGCKEVYITGVDLDYTNGYFNNEPFTDNQRATGMRIMNEDEGQVVLALEDFKTIKEMADNIGVGVYAMDSEVRLAEYVGQKTPDVWYE